MLFIIGIFARIVFFFLKIIKSSRVKDSALLYSFATLGRSLLPFHNAVIKKPLYAILRYIFHICLFAVPIWLAGHIALWEESRFELTWRSLPDAWADWMTLLLLGLAIYFFIRRIAVKDIRINSSGICRNVISVCAGYVETQQVRVSKYARRVFEFPLRRNSSHIPNPNRINVPMQSKEAF